MTATFQTIQELRGLSKGHSMNTKQEHIIRTLVLLGLNMLEASTVVKIHLILAEELELLLEVGNVKTSSRCFPQAVKGVIRHGESSVYGLHA